MSEWTGISEGLPNDGERVLIYSEYGRELVTYNGTENCWDDSDGDDYLYPIEWASHWIALPDSPKGVK